LPRGDESDAAKGLLLVFPLAGKYALFGFCSQVQISAGKQAGYIITPFSSSFGGRPFKEKVIYGRSVLHFAFLLFGLGSLLLGITNRPASNSATSCRNACELILTALPIRMVGIIFLLMSR